MTVKSSASGRPRRIRRWRSCSFFFNKNRGRKKPNAVRPISRRGESNPVDRRTEKKPRAAKRIEGLLHAFADSGFCLGFGALPADFAQAGSEHRRRRKRSRSKGEHDHHDGEKNEDGECQCQRHELDLYLGRWSLVVGRWQNLRTTND